MCYVMVIHEIQWLHELGGRSAGRLRNTCVLPQYEMFGRPCTNPEQAQARNNRMCERERVRAIVYYKIQNVLCMHGLHKEAHNAILHDCENASYRK